MKPCKFLFSAMLLLIVAVFSTRKCHAQSCWLGSGNNEPAKIGLAFTGEYSLKEFKPTRFAGTNVAAGVWVNDLGLQLGFTLYKLNDSTVGTNAFYFSMHYNIQIGQLHALPYIALGLKSFNDYGVRIMYDFYNNGIGAGLVFSKTMHYGIGLTIIPFKK